MYLVNMVVATRLKPKQITYAKGHLPSLQCQMFENVLIALFLTLFVRDHKVCNC